MDFSQRSGTPSSRPETVSSASNPGTFTVRLEQWLERLQAGDETARAALIQHSCQRLRRLTHRMLDRYERLRRLEQTDDVLNAALIRLDRALHSVRPESARDFFRLAAAQVRRELLDLVRKHFGPEGQARHVVSGPAWPTVSATQEPPRLDAAVDTWNPSGLAEWREFHEQVERLPEPEREVFDLLWYQGLSHSDAAHVLGVSPRTVTRRWRSACLLLYRAARGKGR